MSFSGAIKPVPSTPQFRWNSVAKRYIAPNGKFVSVERVRSALDAHLTDITSQMRAVSKQLIDGQVSLGQWQTSMMQLSKEANLSGAAMERGGWYQMTQSDFGKVGQKVKGEYQYLENYAQAIARGDQPLDGTLLGRSQLYGEQGRVTYHDFAAETATADGMDEERSFLTPADHCDECENEDSRGWVPRGSITPIGSRQCLSHCRCYMGYRNSITGAERYV